MAVTRKIMGASFVGAKTGAKKTYDAKKRHEYYMKHRKLKGRKKKGSVEATSKKVSSGKKTTSKKKRTGTPWEATYSSFAVGKGGGKKADVGELQELLSQQNDKILDRISKLKERIAKMSPEERKKNKDKLLKEINVLKRSSNVSARIARLLKG